MFTLCKYLFLAKLNDHIFYSSSTATLSQIFIYFFLKSILILLQNECWWAKICIIGKPIVSVTSSRVGHVTSIPSNIPTHFMPALVKYFKVTNQINKTFIFQNCTPQFNKQGHISSKFVYLPLHYIENIFKVTHSMWAPPPKVTRSRTFPNKNCCRFNNVITKYIAKLLLVKLIARNSLCFKANKPMKVITNLIYSSFKFNSTSWVLKNI